MELPGCAHKYSDMAKKTKNYFPHDGNARNDTKIARVRIKHGAAGYGVYFMLLERLGYEEDYTSPKDYDAIAYDLRADVSLIQSVIEDFGLFDFTEDGRFYSEGFKRRMKSIDEVIEKRIERAKTAAQARWKQSEDNANAQDNNATSIENDTTSIAEAQNPDTTSIENECQLNQIKLNQIKLDSKEPNGSMSETSDAAAVSNEGIDFKKLVEFFNESVKDTSIPTIRQLSGNRKNFVNARLREFGKTAIHTVIKKAAASHFLNGGGSQGFVASFDWIFRPNNFPKILEGNYDNDKNRNYGSRNSDDRTNNGSTGAEPDKPRKRGFTSAWENEQREKQAGGTAGS